MHSCCFSSLEVQLNLQDLLLLLPILPSWTLYIIGKNLLDLFLECLKLVDIVLLLGWVVLKAVLGQLPDLHAVVLQEMKVRLEISKAGTIMLFDNVVFFVFLLTSSLRFLSSLSRRLTCELEILRPSICHPLVRHVIPLYPPVCCLPLVILSVEVPNFSIFLINYK